MAVRVVLYALIILASTAVSFSSYRVFEPVKECIFLCFTALLCFIDRSWLIEQFKGLKSNVADGMLGVLTLYLCISSFWGNPFPVAAVITLHAVLWFLLYLVVKHQFIYEDDMLFLMDVLGLSLVINLIVAGAQLAGIYLPLEIQAYDGPVGLIGNSNWFAIYIALLLMPEIWFLINRRSLPRTILGAFNVVLGIPVLYMTHCRGAWASFIAIVVMWGILRHWGNDVARLKRRIGGFLIAGCALILILLLLSVYMPSILLGIWGGKKQQNVECRMMAYKITWNGAKEAIILGHGLGTFGNDYPKLQAEELKGLLEVSRCKDWILARPFRHVHNDLLELAYEGGLVAILLCLVAGYYIVKKFFFSAQRIPEGQGRQLSHLFFSIGVGFLVASVSSFPFHQTTSVIVFVIVLGALSFEMGGGRRQLPPPGLITTGTFLIVSLTIISIGLCLFMSESAAGDAYEIFKRGEIDEAFALATNAVNMNPWNGKALSLLARCHAAKGEFEKAKEMFKEASLYHYDSSYAFNLGILAIRDKNFVLAKELFIRSLEEYPSPPIFVALGDVNRMMIDYDEAEKMYRMAMEMNRGYGDAGHKLARLYVRQKKFGDAVALLRDNINVFDARRIDGEVSATNAVMLLKDLELLQKTALRCGDAASASYAKKRLQQMKTGDDK
jgi:tetratricopeptide (TPR) repeat protein